MLVEFDDLSSHFTVNLSEIRDIRAPSFKPLLSVVLVVSMSACSQCSTVRLELLLFCTSAVHRTTFCHYVLMQSIGSFSPCESQLLLFISDDRCFKQLDLVRFSIIRCLFIIVDDSLCHLGLNQYSRCGYK